MTGGEPGSSSRVTGSPVLGSGSPGSPSEPVPMGCPPDLASLTVPEVRRLLVVALPPRRSVAWRGHGGAKR
jgi:hypothetical protein